LSIVAGSLEERLNELEVRLAFVDDTMATLNATVSQHDRLLNEVLSADPIAPGFTLMNVLAQERAKKLLESGKDYF